MKAIARHALIFAIVLGACSTKDEPSAANFERSINGVLKERRLCTYVSPMNDAESNTFLFQLARANAPLAERVRADLKAGKAKIVSASAFAMDEQTRQSDKFRVLTALGPPGFLHGGTTYRQPAFAVHTEVAMLNEKGLAHYVEQIEENSIETRSTSRICYGNMVVNKIVRWTAPADLMGYRVVNVEYTLKATDVVDWAKPMVPYLEEEKVRKALMVLGNEGWSVDKSSDVR